jgi:hypothetical protein
MNEVIVLSDIAQMSADEAKEIHAEIVTKVQDVRHLLVRMEAEAGWSALGYSSWEAYLIELGKVTGAGSKYLRRVGNAGLLESDAGFGVGIFKEGTVRPINDILSDTKGYDSDHRVAALELAIELAGGSEELTATVAQTAAWYIVVVENTPDIGQDLVRRMKAGFITPQAANDLCQIMRSTKAQGIEHILALVSDIELADTMITLHSSNGETWQEIRGSIESTGFIPTRSGQVSIDRATNGDLIGYLNEPARLQRRVDEVGEAELYRQTAMAAARLMVSYYGVVLTKLPEALLLDEEVFKNERELYRLCQQAGLIRHGMKA